MPGSCSALPAPGHAHAGALPTALLAWVLVPVTVVGLAGCSAPPAAADGASGAPDRPATLAPDVARARCLALGGQAWPTGSGVRLTQVDWFDEAQVRAVDPLRGTAVGPAVPAHCRVLGRLHERTGIDGEAYGTTFEMRLPARGNGRLLYQGGSGLDGRLPMAVGRNTGADGWADNGLLRGYASVAGDGGHARPDPQFGLDPQARVDHAWRAHELTARAARELHARFYGRPPHHAYVIGCGAGGRQAMMFSQRFPDLVDGVVAVAPDMRAAQGAMVSAAWALQQLSRAAPAGADGQPRLAQALSPRQLTRVAAEIVDRCDAADGLADGLVADTALCRIKLQALRCPAAGDGCLEAAQLDALGAVMAGPRHPDGTALAPGFPWDPGIAAPAWRRWMLGEPGAPGPGILQRSGELGFVHATPPDATLTLAGFDFERDPLRLAASHRLFGTADDVLLKRFRARGGKLLLVHGMADPVVSALQTIDYQERANTAHGAAVALRFMRTFLVPGMNHCEGGPAADTFDGLAAITDWVEHDRAPERLIARGRVGGRDLSRPLCPYPRIARYRSGDPDRADSFDCR